MQEFSGEVIGTWQPVRNLKKVGEWQVKNITSSAY